MIGSGMAIAMMAPEQVELGGWVGGAILCGFAFALLAAFKKGEARVTA
jgi:hypothetical protein